jgi:small subunit ribosomal protein S9
MSDTRESIADQLGATPAPATAAPEAPAAGTPAAPPAVQEAAPLREQQLDKQGRAYATGLAGEAAARTRSHASG